MSQPTPSTVGSLPQSLKAILKDTLLNDMIVKAKGNHAAVVLLVDPHTAKVLSSCARMYDLIDVGVTVLENVQLNRETLQLPAIYFIQPDADNIRELIADFPPSGKSRYTVAHLFFTEQVSKDAMKTLSANKSLISKIKTFVEFNVDWSAEETLVYSLNSQNELLQPETAELDTAARQLITAFLTVKELPYVRYDGASTLARNLAERFNSQLTSLIASVKGWKPSETRPRGSLLIVDRSVDLVEPVIHNFTLQAMVEDLFKVQGELCYLPSHEATSSAAALATLSAPIKPAADANPPLVLSEEDKFWVDYRHQHISDVISQVTASYKEFKRDNATLHRLQTGAPGDVENVSVKELSAAANALPEYKNLIAKYTKMLALATECSRVYNERHLKEISALEQTLATSIDDDGRTVSLSAMREQLIKLCNEAWLGNWEKLRLVLLYILAGGHGDANKKDILLLIPSALQGCIRTLESLMQRNSTGGTSTKAASAARIAEFKAANKASQRINQRYVPALQSVMTEMSNMTLSDAAYPFVQPPPSEWSESIKQSSSRAHRDGTNWHGAAVSDLDTKARHFVFVIGGVTPTEMKLAYDISQSARSNVYIGGETRLSPKRFALALSGMAREAFIRVMKEGTTSEISIYEWGRDDVDMDSWEITMNLDAR